MDKNPKTAKTNWVPAVGKPYSFRKEYGESNNNYLWVWYYDYIPLTEHWREILREEKIDAESLD